MVYFCKHTRTDMNRKLWSILMILSVICLKVYPQGYFCDKEGTKLEYVRKNVKDGSVSVKGISCKTLGAVGELAEPYVSEATSRRAAGTVRGVSAAAKGW